MIHDAGHKVVVGSCTQEAEKVVQVGVLLAQVAQLGQDLHFRERRGQRDFRVTMLLRHVVKQVFYRVHPNGGQHRFPVGCGVGDVAHQ